MRKTLFILGLFFITSLSGCATYKMHPNFKERHPSLHTVAVMPPDVKVYRLSFQGDKDPMHEVTQKANRVASEEITDQLKKKGYALHDILLDEQTLSEHPEVRTAWHTTMELYGKALTDIAKRRQKKFTYTVGPEVNVLADYADVDLLVFLVGEGVKKTGGEITREVVMTVIFGTRTRPSETRMHLAFVDSNTGDILWLNHNNANPGVNPEIDLQMRDAIYKILKPFPQEATRQKESKKKPSRSKLSQAPQQPRAPQTPVPVPR